MHGCMGFYPCIFLSDFGGAMGISAYDSYKNFSQNSIYDRGYELRRQLETRQSQLDKLNSKEVLSSEQNSRKKDLEQTVSLLQGKLDKQLGTTSSQKSVQKTSEPVKSGNQMTFPEGTVIGKSSRPSASYNSSADNLSDSYLKGFFFDARI